jgi:hypothetical protein
LFAVLIAGKGGMVLRSTFVERRDLEVGGGRAGLIAAVGTNYQVLGECQQTPNCLNPCDRRLRLA